MYGKCEMNIAGASQLNYYANKQRIITTAILNRKDIFHSI